jgi:hypothetical protein
MPMPMPNDRHAFILFLELGYVSCESAAADFRTGYRVRILFFYRDIIHGSAHTNTVVTYKYVPPLRIFTIFYAECSGASLCRALDSMILLSLLPFCYPSLFPCPCSCCFSCTKKIHYDMTRSPLYERRVSGIGYHGFWRCVAGS